MTATENAEPAKAPKLEKASQKFYLAANACREGKIYDALRKFVHANPGMTRAELVASAALKDAMDKTRNPEARKKANVTDGYVNGYLTGGLRRGFLTDDPEKASTELTFVEVGKAVSDKASAGELTKSGAEFIATIQEILKEHNAPADTAVSAETIEKKIGRKVALLARTITKLETDGYVDVERAKDDKGEVTKTIMSIKVIKTAPAKAAE